MNVKIVDGSRIIEDKKRETDDSCVDERQLKVIKKLLHFFFKLVWLRLHCVPQQIHILKCSSYTEC